MEGSNVGVHTRVKVEAALPLAPSLPFTTFLCHAQGLSHLESAKPDGSKNISNCFP